MEISLTAIKFDQIVEPIPARKSAQLSSTAVIMRFKKSIKIWWMRSICCSLINTKIFVACKDMAYDSYNEKSSCLCTCAWYICFLSIQNKKNRISIECSSLRFVRFPLVWIISMSMTHSLVKQKIPICPVLNDTFGHFHLTWILCYLQKHEIICVPSSFYHC